MSNQSTRTLGADISHWNKRIDFEKMKAAGVDFVIIKAGGSDKGTYQDSMFETNYTAARKAGLKIGAYYFAGAGFITTTQGTLDAIAFKRILQNKQFEYPVFIDIEHPLQPKHKEGIMAAVNEFIACMQDGDYNVGIYGSDLSTYQALLDKDRLPSVPLWVARYGKEPTYITNWQIWQYTGTGRIDGCTTDIDLNWSVYKPGKDFTVHESHEEAIIKAAKAVLAGRYGNGAVRRLKLEQAGYNYNEVQAMVNKLLKG